MKKDDYIKIAYYYYTLGLTQDEIAKRMSLTRQRVNYIIKSLVELDIVSINIHGYEQESAKLECDLEERYQLNKVIVADDYGEDETSVFKVANVAAQYLDDTIVQGDIIGVSWGRTLEHIVKQMQYRKKETCRVVQLMGAYNVEKEGEKSDELVRSLANHLECPSHIFYAPLIVEHEETKQWLLKEKGILSSYELMEKCNLAIIGVGEISEESTMYRRGYYSKQDIDCLKEEGFIADIVMNPIRKDGTWDECPMSSRIMSAGIDCLRKIDNTVLIAAGEKKCEVIKAALHTGCINTLILDKKTAIRILESE